MLTALAIATTTRPTHPDRDDDRRPRTFRRLFPPRIGERLAPADATAESAALDRFYLLRARIVWRLKLRLRVRDAVRWIWGR